MFLMSFLWSKTFKVAGKERSGALFILTWASSTLDCMSSLIFWPLVGLFPTVYVSALAVGM